MIKHNQHIIVINSKHCSLHNSINTCYLNIFETSYFLINLKVTTKYVILFKSRIAEGPKNMETRGGNSQGNNWGVNLAVALYLSVTNGLYRWISRRKNTPFSWRIYILNIFYVIGILSNIYFINILKDFQIEDVFNIGMLGFNVKILGMFDSIALIVIGKAKLVDPIHFLDYCMVVTFSTIFAYGNISVKYGIVTMFCHSIFKILENSFNLFFGTGEFEVLRKYFRSLKVLINFAMLHKVLFHELGWNIFSMIYYAPVFGHLWFEIKKYYNIH
ncbi:hypothetical protein ACFFRR_001063 [Megaselia abdita]